MRRALAELEHVVWLTAPVDVLLARCGGGAGLADGEGAARPLACDEGVFRRLYAQRRAVYEQTATASVDNDGARPLDEVVAALVALVEGGLSDQTSRSADTLPTAGEV